MQDMINGKREDIPEEWNEAIGLSKFKLKQNHNKLSNTSFIICCF
jgi:hypothetical protein